MKLHDFKAIDINGTERDLSEFAGSLVLVVNTASGCGFTGQYAGLEELYQKYAPEGFSILAFPSNQFANQEPGSNAEIAQFCSTNYGITFDLFQKIEVNGKNAHPLYQWLTAETNGILGGKITWNFTKILIGKDGQIIKRFAPTTAPHKLSSIIEANLREDN